MDFVCQIACADVATVAPHLRGHLLFFVPAQAVMDGREIATVVHVNGSSGLVSFSPKPGEYFWQIACVLSAFPSSSLPSPMDAFQSPDTQPWHEMDEALKPKFMSVYFETTRIPDDPYHDSWHRFMGHPNPIQYDWRPYLRGVANPSDWIFCSPFAMTAQGTWAMEIQDASTSGLKKPDSTKTIFRMSELAFRHSDANSTEHEMPGMLSSVFPIRAICRRPISSDD